ncbi:fibroblast growth factor receptor 1-like isoform X2 [Oscarella lobularis]|uniref:fibroblast growth factor receptor 1-like isoform X2 n=1 Tax=Oscarella lobularis TaxID=121494 RepID=UPI003313A28E
MQIFSLKFCIGYFILSIGSRVVQTYECYCQRDVMGKTTRSTKEFISVRRGDVVDVTCHRPRLDGDGLTWKTTANHNIESCNPSRNDDDTCWTYVSKLTRKLKIRSASFKKSQRRRQFHCNLEDLLHPTNCCTVTIVIDSPTTNANNINATETTSTTILTKTKTTTKETPKSMSLYGSTAPTTNHSSLNSTSFQNVSSATFTSRQTAIISATVCVIAAVFIGVAAAVTLALKRKRFTSDASLDKSTDNLTDLLDVKEQKIWNGNKIIPIDCLSVGKSLGEGQFGTVTEGKLRTTSQQGEIYDKRIAIKMLRDREGVDVEELRKEAEIIVNLGQHDNVILVYGYCIEEKCVSKIVMEYAKFGDLHCHLRKLRSTGLDDAKQFAFAQQIAEGMNFVASKGCIHRDLAARNVLVCTGQRLKISDFGLAKDLKSAAYYRKTSRGGVIPFRWCAPEVLLYRTYSEYSDVWSYGIILWEIATLGGTPYPGVPVEKLFELLTGKSGYRMSKPRNCSEKLYDVMLRCWTSVPDTRPTFLRLTSDYMQRSGVQY